MAHENARSFAVIGLGTFGSTVASDLARFGNPVLGIDIDERRVAAIADTVTEAIIDDDRDEEALREAGVGVHDVAGVAIGEDLKANIPCTMNVRRSISPTLTAIVLTRRSFGAATLRRRARRAGTSIPFRNAPACAAG